MIDTKQRDRVVDYAMDTIRNICRSIPPREPGSAAEHAAENLLAKDIEQGNWADDITFQPFRVAPKAFMGFSKLIPLVVFIGAVLFVFFPWAPLVFNTLSLLILLGEFVLYKPLLDVFYPKKESANLIARKKPAGEIKRRIIFSGHIDAAYEWTLFYKFGPLVHIGGQIVACMFLITTCVFSVLSLIRGTTPLWQQIAALGFTVGYLPLFLFSNYKRVVPGANDNLTGCLASVGILKYLSESNITLQNTEVICAVMGSEEAGLRGAKAFARAYGDELRDKSIPTCYIGLETFRDEDFMAVFTKDLSGTLSHSKSAIHLADTAATALFGKPLEHSSVYLGATDAAAMTQAGLHALTIAAMDPAPAKYYHTRRDDENNLNPACFAKGFDLALTILEQFDQNEDAFKI